MEKYFSQQKMLSLELDSLVRGTKIKKNFFLTVLYEWNSARARPHIKMCTTPEHVYNGKLRFRENFLLVFFLFLLVLI